MSTANRKMSTFLFSVVERRISSLTKNGIRLLKQFKRQTPFWSQSVCSYCSNTCGDGVDFLVLRQSWGWQGAKNTRAVLPGLSYLCQRAIVKRLSLTTWVFCCQQYWGVHFRLVRLNPKLTATHIRREVRVTSHLMTASIISKHVWPNLQSALGVKHWSGLSRRNLRLRKFKQLVCGHTGSNGQSQDIKRDVTLSTWALAPSFVSQRK